MRKAIKKTKLVTAVELGQDSELECKLIKTGSIKLNSDGTYRIFSREAREQGEIAKKGDFIKLDELDGTQLPYPNEHFFFLSRHIRIDETDQYKQVSRPVSIWFNGDAPCPEIQFLFKSKLLDIDDRSFKACVWGVSVIAPLDSVIVCYDIRRDEDGNIIDIDFALVDRKIFERDYVILQENISKKNRIS